MLSTLSSRAIEVFKPEEITAAMAWRVIKQDYKFTKLIPANVWTEDMAEWTTHNSAEFIRFIPDTLLTHDRVNRALSTVKNRLEDWNWIPQRFVNEQILDQILNLSEYTKYRFIESIEEDTWTQAMADIAFTTNSDFAEKIPKKFVRGEWANKISEVKEKSDRIDWDDILSSRAESNHTERTKSLWENFLVINPIPVLNDPVFLATNRLNTEKAKPKLAKQWNASFLEGLVEDKTKKSLGYD